MPQGLFISGTVIEPITGRIYYRNHVGGVFGDELEKFVALDQLPPHSLQLHVLIHRVDIKHQHQSGESAHPIAEVGPILAADSGVLIEKSKEDNTRSEGESNYYGESPQPPFTALDLVNFEGVYPVASGGSTFRGGRHAMSGVKSESISHARLRPSY